MRSDVFRPRLPIDPFDDAQPPWLPDLDAVPAEPHTVLVLGAAAPSDLVPLTLSPHLASSLLLIATHTPPPVPEAALCPVVILRLPAPLDIHDAGAVRLVSVLDRAQRVAQTWHAAPHAQPRIQQLAELYPGGEFSIAEPPEFALPASCVAAAEGGPDSSETSSLASSTSAASSSSSFSSFAHKPAQHYTFSALISFLPPTLPDKALLKHAILVTTLSAPFLAAQPPPLPYTKRQSIFSSLSLSSETPCCRRRRRSRIVSLFSRKQAPCSYGTPSLRTSRAPSAESLLGSGGRHAHLVHVLPHRRASPAKTKLAQSIEQFLLSFAYPPSASAPSLASLSASLPPPSHRPATPRSSPLASPAASLPTVHSTTPRRSSVHPASQTHTSTPAVPYVLPAGLLGAYPAQSKRCVGELVLCGVLDGVASGLAVGAGVGAGGGWPRAWIGAPGDVVVGRQAGSVEDGVEGAGGEQEDVERGEAKGVERGETKGVECGEAKGDEREENTNADAKSKSKSKRRRTRATRNEAGLPTPPESSSSADGGSSDDGAGAGASNHNHDHNEDRSCSDDEGEGEGTEDSHASRVSNASAPVPGTKSQEHVSAADEGPQAKAMSEAHFGVDAGTKGVKKQKLRERVAGFWGGLWIGRLGR